MVFRSSRILNKIINHNIIMSLPTQPTIIQPSVGERGADQVRRLAHQSAKRMLRDVNQGLNAIWGSSDVASVLSELGAEAAEVFELNNNTITFLATNLAGTGYQAEVDAILAQVAELPPFTINGDGTVTLD